MLTFKTLYERCPLQYNVENSYLILYSLGCDPNRYSTGCNQICPPKCKNSHCDAFNGSCIHGCSNPNALTVDCLGKISVLFIMN